MNSNDPEERFGPWSPAVYQIEVEGELPSSFTDCFGAMKISTRSRKNRPVVTSLTGPVEDQSALLGLLAGLVDLHVPILAVQCQTGLDS